MKPVPPRTIIASVLALIGVATLIGAKSVSVEAVYPVERARRTFTQKVLSRLVGCVKGARAQAEVARLRREVASLAMLKYDLDRLEAENARLRRALEYRAGDPATWVAAGVLSAGGGAAGARTTLRVDKGTLADVRLGAVVAVPEGLVGKVTAVTPHTCEVTLVTDRALKVACEVEAGDQTRPRGILCGGDEESLCLRHLLDAAEVPPRSRVLTSGLGGVFPKGLEVGTLLVVRKDARGLACEGEVQPSVDFASLEDVFIRREQ